MTPPKQKLRAYDAIVDGKTLTVIDPEGSGLVEIRKTLVKKFGFSRVGSVKER